MAKKLTFEDVYQNELAPSKLNFGSLNVALSISTGAPSADADIGTLYIDSDNGYLYRKTVAGAGASNWVNIAYGNNSVSNTVYANRIRPLTITSFTNGSNFLTGDLVGVYGVGSWLLTASTSATRLFPTLLGAVSAAIIHGGRDQIGAGGLSTSEVFNGTVWANGGSTVAAKYQHGSCGSLNAGLVTGGAITASSIYFTNTEFYNGSAWLAGPNLNTFLMNGGTFGESMAAVAIWGNGDALTTPGLFNGTSWVLGSTVNISRDFQAAFGTANAGVMTSGKIGINQPWINVTTITELFNGSTWQYSGYIGVGLGGSGGGYGAGSQNAGLASTGLTGFLFNGSVWNTESESWSSMIDARGSGSQAHSVHASGWPYSNSKETYVRSQATHKKIYARKAHTASKIGIYDGTNIVTQGNVSFTYPANKYLVLNRSAICSVTNESTLVSITFSSISGTAPVMTYNFSGTMSTLCIANGNIAVVTSTGANPCAAENAGTFVIVRQVNPTSIEVSNASGVAENPGTGTISILSSIMAVDNITPEDIVIGKTNSLGNLYIPKPLQIGSMARRLR